MERKLTATQRTVVVTTVGATAAVSLSAGMASIAAADPVRISADSDVIKVCVDSGKMRLTAPRVPTARRALPARPAPRVRPERSARTSNGPDRNGPGSHP